MPTTSGRGAADFNFTAACTDTNLFDRVLKTRPADDQRPGKTRKRPDAYQSMYTTSVLVTATQCP